jgi:hypothetical protein
MIDDAWVLANIPLGDRFEVNGTGYEYDIISKERGRLHFGTNGDSLTEINFTDAPNDFKQHLAQLAGEKTAIRIIEAQIGRKIEASHVEAYLKAWQYLYTGDNAFLTYCALLIFDYHALDRELTQTVLLAMTRASYSSPSSALLHLDCTGASGAGKNDLISRATALIPSQYLELFSTVSPTALQYKTIERVRDKNGRVVDVRANKDRFKGKIVCITEVADAAGFSALKALAETEEQAEYTHMATVNGVAIDMTITGHRCVIITSVEGVNDDQVKRRFIHGSVSDDSLDDKKTKLKLIESLLKDRKDIHDDPRLKIAQAGIDLIFSTKAVIFEPTEDEAWGLIQELNDLFLEAGYGITSIKQFFSLCECIALWKRFYRDCTRIEVEDVREAWFLLATFERETITKTSRQGIETLKAIKSLCDEENEKYELDSERYDGDTPKRPTRREVVKESSVSQAHVYRLLNSRPNDHGKCGELIELGYVRDVESGGQLAVELTELGKTVLGDVPDHAIANMEEYTPKEPILPDDERELEARLNSLDAILMILTDSHGHEKI